MNIALFKSESSLRLSFYKEPSVHIDKLTLVSSSAADASIIGNVTVVSDSRSQSDDTPQTAKRRCKDGPATKNRKSCRIMKKSRLSIVKSKKGSSISKSSLPVSKASLPLSKSTVKPTKSNHIQSKSSHTQNKRSDAQSRLNQTQAQLTHALSKKSLVQCKTTHAQSTKTARSTTHTHNTRRKSSIKQEIIDAEIANDYENDEAETIPIQVFLSIITQHGFYSCIIILLLYQQKLIYLLSYFCFDIIHKVIATMKLQFSSPRLLNVKLQTNKAKMITNGDHNYENRNEPVSSDEDDMPLKAAGTNTNIELNMKTKNEHNFEVCILQITY